MIILQEISEKLFIGFIILVIPIFFHIYEKKERKKEIKRNI